MKKILLFSSFAILVSCQQGINQEEYNKIVAEKDSLTRVVASKEQLIASMRDSISILSYPADQRLAHINELIKSESYKEAKNEISTLQKVFPHSKEASSSKALLAKIQDIEAKKEAEIQRIKALGFKAIKATPTVTIDYNTATFSLSVANVFTFDSYGDRYFYRDADRGYKYVTGSMTIKSSSKYPELPEPQLYEIVGDKMEKSSSFDTEFARWEDYGSYLGNYHDSGNDFKKTSTVRFKIAASIETETISKKPIAVVLKHKNFLTRHEDRHDNPPVSYIGGSREYPNTLTLEDFTSGEYHVIKYFNF